MSDKQPPILLQTPSLQITIPFGKLISQIIIFLIILASLLEIAAHFEIIRQWLPQPSYTGIIYKVSQVEELDESSTDCFFIGNSLVNRGINPEIFSNAYQNTVGQAITCYNFGISGLGTADIPLVIEYLVDSYHPTILIVGVSPISTVERDARDFDDREEYLLGIQDATLNDQLREYFIFYDHLHNLPEGQGQRRKESREYRTGQSTDVMGHVPLPYEPSNYYVTHVPEIIQQKFENFDLDEASLQATFSYLADLENVEIYITEDTMPPQYMNLLGEDYNRIFLSTISRYSEEYGFTFVPLNNSQLIPNDGWSRASHLNVKGVEIYSTWLGEQLGELISQ